MYADGLSVVLPLFNGDRFVSAAIHSVINQTHLPTNWELIVVDDGSSDDGPICCDEIAKFYPQINVVRQTKNFGVAASRNYGAELAKYKYLAFIDQDDLWMPNKLKIQLDLLSQTESEIYILGHQEFFIEPGFESPKWFKSDWAEKPQKGFVLGSMLIRTATFLDIGKLDETLMLGGDDVDWFARARHRGCIEIMLSEIVLRRRVHDKNASARVTSKHELLHLIRKKIARES